MVASLTCCRWCVRTVQGRLFRRGRCKPTFTAEKTAPHWPGTSSTFVLSTSSTHSTTLLATSTHPLAWDWEYLTLTLLTTLDTHSVTASTTATNPRDKRIISPYENSPRGYNCHTRHDHISIPTSALPRHRSPPSTLHKPSIRTVRPLCGRVPWKRRMAGFPSDSI